MQETKNYTPGPWDVVSSDDFKKLFSYDETEDPLEGAEYAILAEDPFDPQPWLVGSFSLDINAPGKKTANARLISAAPDLVEAIISRAKSDAYANYMRLSDGNEGDKETAQEHAHTDWPNYLKDDAYKALIKAGVITE